MQAIARVNRVFRDKPGGLVVDYLGLAQELKAALATYTESGGKGRTAIDQDEAVRPMLENTRSAAACVVDGFDWSAWTTGHAAGAVAPAAGGPGARPGPGERQGALPPGGRRAVAGVCAGRAATSEALAHPRRPGVLPGGPVGARRSGPRASARPEEELDHAMRQIVSKAVAPEGVVDIFAAAGLDKPDISILSDEFLAEVRGMPPPEPRRGAAPEAPRRARSAPAGARTSSRPARSPRCWSRRIRRYQNRAIEAAQVIEELIAWRRRCERPTRRGEELGLTEDELAFYDALETNDSAVEVLGDETLRDIAHELVETVRDNVTIDWTLRENVRAQLRVLVKRILRKHGYPPDKQEKATQTVLEQAEALSSEWAVA